MLTFAAMRSAGKKKVFTSALLWRVFDYTRPYRIRFGFSIILALLLSVLAPVRPMLIQATMDRGLRGGPGDWFFSGPGGFLLEITLIQIGILFIETTARFLFSFLTAGLGQSVIRDLRQKTYEKILGLNLSQFDKTPIGTLTTRTVNDIESVNEIFSDGFVPILADILSILSVLAYMFYTDWRITLICLAPFPLLIGATYFFKESVNKSFTRVRNAVANLNAFVQEHITGMTIVQAFAAEKQEETKFNEINKEHRNANIKAIFAYSVFFPVVELVSAVSVGLLIWWTAKDALHMGQQEAGRTAGIITSFILCLQLLFRPLRILADKFNVLQMGMIASERVFKVLDNKEVLHETGTIRDINIKGHLEFRNVWMAYRSGQYVLRGISFSIESGQTLAIVGHTGSGKSSLIGLINRMYGYEKGEILLDGLPIEKYESGFLRSSIGLVLQDVFLFSGSILDNITLRNPEISRERVVAAAQLIGIHDFISKLPGAYDYDLSERGGNLSMGQRQLLSFLRALLYDPTLLILDEATSSVDAESELLIQNATEKLIVGRTAIVIAHRLSTIKKADRILVLEKGEIAEMGSHEELLERNGPYSKLYYTQFAGGGG